MSIQQSTELIIFVTHVEAEDTFLKIWGQVDKNSATCVERMILPLVEQFARSQGCIGSQSANLCINALCCARFQNEGYYRAKVINIRPDGMVVLQFIDYGNIEVLPPQEIHLLENISGSESLQSFPPVAFEFTLMNVLPANTVWENKIIESIKKTLWYNEYKILIHTVVNNHCFIKLWYNNEDFSELLIKEHMAIRATLQDMFRSKRVQPVPGVAAYQIPMKRVSSNCNTVTPMRNTNTLRCDANEMHGYQRSVPLCCVAQQKHMMQTPCQEALVFKSRVLDVSSKHDIYVSFVEDGPHKFSVQLQSTTQILSLLMREINSHPIEPLKEPPLPGSVCLGRYTQDKVLCRAVVMSVMENKCKLYYVDFGHTEILSYTDIFQLPPHFINPRVLSIRFTLSGVHELNATDEMKAYFKQIVSGKPLVLHVRPPEGPPLVQYGDLYDNGKNIKDILRQVFPTPVRVISPFAYQEPKKLSKGVEEIVYVSFVESCKKFFVQLESNAKSLELIMNSLADFCRTAPALNLAQLKIGLPCAALYDNQWYRAQILGINADNIKVLYVDYGNEETVTLVSLRMICDDLVKKLQAQAIKCSLNGWELLPCSQEVHNQFELLVLEKRLRTKVVDINMDGLVIDLYEPERNENIKSQLLHIIGTEKPTKNDSLDYQDTDSQNSIRITPKINQGSYTKLQMNLVQQRKNRINIEAIRENTNKWQKKNQSDTWHQSQNSNIVQERNKFKTWKDESNEGKIHENRNEKSNFHRNSPRSERFNRDDFSNDRNTKDKWNNRNDHNESFKRVKDARGGRNKSSGFISKSHSSEKSWSDKDSDTSSRGSGRRGRGSGARGGYSKREGTFGRTQSNKNSDRDSDGSFKSGRTNSDSYHVNNKFRERKGQGYRLSQSKMNVINNSSSDGEGRRYSPMRNRNVFHIPRPNITVGSTKTCEVVFTNSLYDFFVQLSSDYTALDSVMGNIASIYENNGDLMKESEISSGVYCIAQYSEDLKWYRAVIKSVEGRSATVQFVDYGNTEIIQFNKIKSIQKEFLKLPIQAVHCRLLGIKNDAPNKDKTKNFEDIVSGKTLEAEFVTEESGIYSVLLKEIVDGMPSSTFVNEKFCEGIDLLKAKEAAISSKTVVTDMKQFSKPDYAPLDAKWATVSYTPETKKDVIVTWFTNPNNFYCQILDNENEFRAMMNEIQKIYVGREPVSYALQVGSPVIAVFSDDGALYRAEVIELNKLTGHLIQYVDFGNNALVDTRKIYPVEKKLMNLPKQAVQCSLLNIVPQNNLGWSKVNTQAIDNCFNADKYECIFHDVKDNKYSISLTNNGVDVAKTLVEKNLASFSSEIISDTTIEDKNVTTPIISCDIEKVDINLLSGQTLRVKVSSVENTSKFYIQLPSAAECEDMIDTYMANKNPMVMQQLSTHEICLGTGCLVYSNGVWRRAVISSHIQSTGFDVKFIDTGAYDEILSDSVLALPGELSVMQNQAVECSLANVTSSSTTDVALKKCIEGKEVIIHVDEVDNNRLIVKLFDLNGNQINISGDSDEKILPICPMLILSSTHKVSISYADHSASIWLQRNAEYTLDKELIEALDQYYSVSGNLVEPKENLLCAVKSIDGHWYRAKVLKCTETGVYVNFIDYGNNEEVAPDVVMALDSRFYTPHQLAINVSLPITLNCPISEQLNILQDHLSNKELTAVFRNVNKKWIVELLYNGEKISDKFRSINSTLQQETSGARKPYIHNMTVGCKYNVYVSHVDSPSQFWLQHMDDAMDLSTKQQELQAQASTFSQVDGILEEGSLCAAVYTIDNLWYRAQVLDADEDITTVRFIDYGNTDVIDNKSGNIRSMPDSWKEMKEYSIKCRLDVIPVDSEDWSTTTCKKFENLITSVESLQAVIVAPSVPKRVDLLINDKSVSETLVDEHHAVKVHREEELIDEIIDLELDPHSAFVSHVNSPSEFWVQEEKSVGDLEVMTDRFIVAHMFPKVEEIEENMLCVAKYPEDDCWYRARVISHSDNATRVIYIDYGNSATSTEIRAIPADLADIPPLSRKCSLVMPEGITEWSEKACEEFIALAADGATIFLLDVIKEDETSLVKLTLDGKNVADVLAEFCEHYPPIIEERLPPLGEENSPNVFISRVNSPDDFWIQTESSITDLNMMLDRLQAAPTFVPLNTSEVGTICAANYSEDDQWYRAKILSQSEHGTKVLYIDYGNTAVTNEIRMLPVDIINIAPLAKHCALKKPDTIDCWPSEACKTFEELAVDGETMFQFEILDDTTDPIYVKLSYNGRNVVDILVPFSEIISKDTTTKKDEKLCENESGNSEETIKTKDRDETNNGDDSEEYSANVNRSQDDIESLKEQIKDNRNDSHLDAKSIVELTVDEIVQNMQVDEPEDDEETLRSDNNATELHKKDDIYKITKDLEHLETNTETQACREKNEIQDCKTTMEDSKEYIETKAVNEEILSSAAEKMSLNTVPYSSDIVSNFENVEKEQDSIHAYPETQICNNETEICIKNSRQETLSEVSNNETKISESNINTQDTEDSKKENISETRECNNEKEISESNIDIQSSENSKKEKISKTERCNNEVEVSESNINIQCNENSEASGLQSEILVSEQSAEVLKETVNILKNDTEVLSTTEKEKRDTEDCKIQNSNELKVNSMADPKDCSDVKNTEEKISLNLHLTETASQECKIISKHDTVTLTDTTVSEQVTTKNDVENSSQLKNVTTSE